MTIYIYGAKSIALGVCRAMQALYPQHKVAGFIVSSMDGNPEMLAGLPVMAFDRFREMIVQDRDALPNQGVSQDMLHILIATPEDVHAAIVSTLRQAGIEQYTCIDSRIEAELMERYYASDSAMAERFPSLHASPEATERTPLHEEESAALLHKMPQLQVYAATFYRDKPLRNGASLPEWVIPLQVGAALTDVHVAKHRDDTGENISEKNKNYCELTALYWIWKNGGDRKGTDRQYSGLFHYRRFLEIRKGELQHMAENDVDVVLPYPMLHEPDITEHHTRYIKESDWEAMLQALHELQPEYAEAANWVFREPYMYNYNMLVAKKTVLDDYCEWLFPVLERVEKLTDPDGSRADRYMGYLGENLMTLYFMYHLRQRRDLKIAHTGRIMLT